MTKAHEDALMALPGYIVLIKKPGDNTWYGPVECSFALDVMANRTRFFWSGNAYMWLGPTEKPIVLDGKKSAEKEVKYWEDLHPDWTFSLWDARDAEKLPVIINWEKWLVAEEPDPQKMSGIADKFGGRNVHIRDKNAIVPVGDLLDEGFNPVRIRPPADENDRTL